MKTFKGPNKIKVICDEKEIFPNDPGQGTPVMVYVVSGGVEYGATWNCATSTGEIDGLPIDGEQSNFLDEISTKVEQWMQENGG